MTHAHSCGNCEGVDPDTCLANPDRTTPAPALRDQVAAAIASYDHAVGQATDPAPGDHHYGQADAVLAARDRELERLPDDVLGLLLLRSYLSTACETARVVDIATIRHPDRADLPAWVERLHGQCPTIQQFTGIPCRCTCHQPTATA